MAQTIILKELLDYAVELLLKLVREYLGQAHGSHPCSLWTELMPRGLCKYFCNADEWVRNALDDPETLARYTEAGRWQGLSAYEAALQDCCQGPVIGGLDLSDYDGEPGDEIRVRAWDDVQVVEVFITISGGDERHIESGKAKLSEDGAFWVYTATARAPTDPVIAIEAFDLPGNRAWLESRGADSVTGSLCPVFAAG